MSLHRIAARIAAVQALKGRTLVGDNVLDSEIGAIDIGVDGSVSVGEDQRKPFIAVYSDASENKDEIPSDMARALVPNGKTDFLFEAGVTAVMTEVDPETDESTLVGIGIPAVDSAFEFQLDVIMRQIADCLSDPTNEWAEVFRTLCGKVVAIERNRTSGEQGTRLAAHQLKLTVDLCPDPVRGIELKPPHPLMKFFALAETITVPNPDRTMPNPDYPHNSDFPRIDDPDAPEFVPDPVVAAQIDVMRAQLTGDEHEWQLALRRYGMTRGEADALLITPPAGTDGDIDIAEVVAGGAEPKTPVIEGNE